MNKQCRTRLPRATSSPYDSYEMPKRERRFLSYGATSTRRAPSASDSHSINGMSFENKDNDDKATMQQQQNQRRQNKQHTSSNDYTATTKKQQQPQQRQQ